MPSNSILRKLSVLALGALFATGATVSTAHAQDAGALLNGLVKKGILTDQEAEDIRAELATESAQSVLSTLSGGKSTTGLSFTGRLQVQYANLGTSDADDLANQARVSHLFMRRLYIGMKANIGADFTADFNYDFAGGTFDKAYVRWAGNILGAPLSFDAGFRKPNFGYEEFTSSGSLKSIERSGITRYFAEDSNGRRLGTTSYRLGLFADFNSAAFAGKTTGFFAGVAVTNPERVATPASVAAVGDNNTNKIAVWANAGYSGKVSDATWLVGVAGAHLPGMGGVNTAAGGATRGSNVDQFSAYADVTIGNFQIAGEFLYASVENGIGGNTNADVYGFWIQPTYKINEDWEIVGRFSYTDAGKRGVRVSDGVRSATSRGGSSTGKTLLEYYIGANYYIVGNDVKLQFGYVGGQTSGSTAADGSFDRETVHGFRSQIQVNF